MAPLVGHVGDGNFHLGFLIDRNDPAELAEAERLNERLVMRALAMDGTCTGEHGIGLGKQKFLIAEHGEAVSVMREIKKALGPAEHSQPGEDFLALTAGTRDWRLGTAFYSETRALTLRGT